MIPFNMDQLPDEVSAQAAQVFFRIQAIWELNDSEGARLLGCAPRTLRRWREHPDQVRFTAAQLEALGYIFGIWEHLHAFLPSERQAEWLRRPNMASMFDGRPPREHLLAGSVADLYAIHRHLGVMRGGWV